MSSSDKTSLAKWRKACMERDRGRCVLTGGEGTTVHHIIKCRFQEFRYDTDNGVTLSAQMHRWVEDNPKAGMRAIRPAVGAQRFNVLMERFKVKYNREYKIGED